MANEYNPHNCFKYLNQIVENTPLTVSVGVRLSLYSKVYSESIQARAQCEFTCINTSLFPPLTPNESYTFFLNFYV